MFSLPREFLFSSKKSIADMSVKLVHVYLITDFSHVIVDLAQVSQFKV